MNGILARRTFRMIKTEGRVTLRKFSLSLSQTYEMQLSNQEITRREKSLHSANEGKTL